MHIHSSKLLNRLFRTLLCIQFLTTVLAAADIEGYWKFTEESVQEITAFMVNSTPKPGEKDEIDPAEVSESYRNHLREFKLTGEDSILVRLIQFAGANDRYPEYIRKFNMDYAETEDGVFTISKGANEIFTGQVSDGSLHLKDSGTGNTLELRKVSMADYPFLTEKIFQQGQLDRKPKAKKLTTPIYPPKLKEAGITGTVEIEFKVNPDGTTSEIQVISSPYDAFSVAAIEAIRTSTFRPGQVDRKPVRTHVKLPISFR